MYYVYVLKGIKYYVGVTQDINRRLEEHRRGNSYFTRRIGKDITLIGWFACKEKKEAFALEAKIKRSGHIERWIKEKTFVMGE